MTDRDDALRRKLGWTGPEETDFEPPADEPEPAPPPPRQVPPRPPVDYVPPTPPDTREDEPAAPAEPTRVANLPTSETGSPQPFQGDRAAGRRLSSATARPLPSGVAHGPPPGAPRDTGSVPGAEPRRRHTVEPAAGSAATPPGASADAARPTTATTGSAVAPRRIPAGQSGGTTRRAVHMRTGSGPTTSFRHDAFRRAGAGALRCSRPPSGW